MPKLLLESNNKGQGHRPKSGRIIIKMERRRIYIFEDELSDLGEGYYEFVREHEAHLVLAGPREGILQRIRGRIMEEYCPERFESVSTGSEVLGSEEVSSSDPICSADYYFFDGLEGTCFSYIEGLLSLGVPRDRIFVVSGDRGICDEAERMGLALGRRRAETLEEAIGG